MEIKFILIFVFLIILASCGRADYAKKIGNGYQYSYTSSIGRRIVKNLNVVVDTAVLGYASNKGFIIAVRLVGQKYRCKSKRIELAGSVSQQVNFIDQLEYYLVNKKTGEIQVFLNKKEFYSQAALIGIKNELDIDEKARLFLLGLKLPGDIDSELAQKYKL